jgi:hypothetical protein
MCPGHPGSLLGQKRARLKIISHFLSQVRYKEVRMKEVKLPKRQKAHGYKEPAHPFKFVSEEY